MPSPHDPIAPQPAGGHPSYPAGHTLESTRGWITRHRLVVGGVGVVAIAAILFFALRPAGPSKRAKGTGPVPVVAADATQQVFPITIAALGTVQAYNTVDVHSQTTGTIDKVDFTEGQMVHVGDLLAEIDPRPLQAALGQAEAALARDQASLANANRDLARYQTLSSQGFATAQQFDTQKSAVAQLEAAIKGDEAMISGARTNLSYARITAPIDGVTGLRGIDVGNVVHPTDTTGLVTIATVEPIAIVFTMPAQNLPTVQVQMKKSPLTAQAFDQDNKVMLDTGTLKVVDNQVDAKTGTVRMKAEFPNQDHKLWPGAFVNVRLTVANKSGVTIPVTAIQHGAEGVFVYVIGADGKAEARAVKLNDTHEDTALLDDGVRVGEKVVVDGQARLSNGAMTKIVPRADQSASAGKPPPGKDAKDTWATPEGNAAPTSPATPQPQRR